MRIRGTLSPARERRRLSRRQLELGRTTVRSIDSGIGQSLPDAARRQQFGHGERGRIDRSGRLQRTAVIFFGIGGPLGSTGPALVRRGGIRLGSCAGMAVRTTEARLASRFRAEVTQHAVAVVHVRDRSEVQPHPQMGQQRDRGEGQLQPGDPPASTRPRGAGRVRAAGGSEHGNWPRRPTRAEEGAPSPGRDQGPPPRPPPRSAGVSSATMRSPSPIGPVALLSLSLLPLLQQTTTAQRPVRVPDQAQAAVDAYLAADDGARDAALKAAIKALRGKVDVAAAALRDHAPLSALPAGTHHGQEFESGGHTWRYSIRLPKGYDEGDARYPVLMLPDHGLVDEEAGIAFWEQDEQVEDCILFRPVIVKHQDDAQRFPDRQFFAVGAAVAQVYRDALRHLRLHHRIDHDRIVMTGLSQAGYYTEYLAISFPDQFAAIAPESAGGMAVTAAVIPCAPNLRHLHVRLLHTRDDQITPFEHAEQLLAALQDCGAEHAELIAYTDADYLGEPFPKRHPGPHHLRVQHVYDPLLGDARRSIPSSFERVLRYPQQGSEGCWQVAPPDQPSPPRTVRFEDDDGALSCSQAGAVYRVHPDDLSARRTFVVDGKKLRPKADLELLLTDFLEHGDPARMTAATIRLDD